MKCSVCRDDILEGHRVQVIPPARFVKRGPRTGALVLYEDPMDAQVEDDFVHYPECCVEFFNPDLGSTIHDQLFEEARELLEETIREEIEDEFQKKFDEIVAKLDCGDLNFCQECWDDLEDPNDDQEELRAFHEQVARVRY